MAKKNSQIKKSKRKLKSALIEFKKQLKIKHPKLEAELYLMDFDGSVISFD